MNPITFPCLPHLRTDERINLLDRFQNQGILLKRCKTICLIVGGLICPLVFAGNGIDSSTIPYKSWPHGRPASVSVISGRVSKNLRLFGGILPQGVSWETSRGEPQEKFRQQICALAKEPCKPLYRNGVGIGELFLGDPAASRLPRGGHDDGLHRAAPARPQPSAE